MLLVMVLGVVIVGASLPVRHRVSRTVTLRATPAQVYALVSDVAAYPTWRTGVERAELLPGTADASPPRFREHGADGTILFEIVERVPDSRMVTRIADPSLPFGGRWTYDISPTAAGTELRITEDGEVYNPIFRFVSRFVMGHARTIDRYLEDVRTRLEARPRA